ncbi:MAG: Crp/Fnr family transcriptional regulator [Sphingobacteriia bacterium]|nr:Crp/Fnr family transcriptional regulator [Sphingobacteriia bacterium]
MFVLKGCLRQYVVNEKGEESIIYFAEERHFIGDLSSVINKTISIYNFQAIEACELLTISAEHWEKAFIHFPWWTEAHVKVTKSGQHYYSNKCPNAIPLPVK